MRLLGLEITIRRAENDPEPTDIDKAYIALNNLYLRAERRGVVTKAEGLKMLELAKIVSEGADWLEEYWMGEFRELEGWLDV